jgi:bacterioferritin
MVKKQIVNRRISMDKDEVVRILNEDFVDELEATMVYIRNTFLMNKCDPSQVTEAIGVDDMRHMWWLADLITKRGGKPTMEHKVLDFGGDDLKNMLERQIELETADIEKYKRQIDTINDPEVVGVLKHILDEEKRHRKEFRERLKKYE